MGFTEFVWARFGRSLVQKGAFMFLGLMAAFFTAPHMAPILATLGMTVQITAELTTITIVHATFAAGAVTLLLMGAESLRVLGAKHPKSPLPEAVKKVL